MKKFNKTTAVILSVIMFLVLAVGFVFSFVPIKLRNSKFVSLSGTINISSDMVGGLYGEYEIKNENPSEKDIIQTVSLIRGVFEEDGYKNVNVYAVGNKKVRVELSYPNADETFATSYAKLKNVGAGAFSLSNVNPSSSTSSAESTVETLTLEGSKYVKEVRVSTNNDQKYISVVFNEEGKAKYEEICNNTESSTIYLVLGDYSQGITISGVYDYSELTLSNTDWENMIALEQKIKLGCTTLDLDGTNSIVNTMSATLSSGEASSSPANESFFSSTLYVVAFSALLMVVIIMIAVFAIKFGLFALIATIAMLIVSYLYLFIVWLVPSFEIGLSVILSILIGVSLIFAYAFNFAQTVKDEYNEGKSIQASLESSYKKSILGELITNLMLFVSSLILTALSFSELTSVAVSFAILSALSLFTNLCVIPFLVKLGISFRGIDRKLFLLKKRKSLADLDEENQEDVEA